MRRGNLDFLQLLQSQSRGGRQGEAGREGHCCTFNVEMCQKPIYKSPPPPGGKDDVGVDLSLPICQLLRLRASFAFNEGRKILL